MHKMSIKPIDAGLATMFLILLTVLWAHFFSTDCPFHDWH